MSFKCPACKTPMLYEREIDEIMGGTVVVITRLECEKCGRFRASSSKAIPQRHWDNIKQRYAYLREHMFEFKEACKKAKEECDAFEDSSTDRGTS